MAIITGNGSFSKLADKKICTIIYRCKLCGEIMYEDNIRFSDAQNVMADFTHKCEPFEGPPTKNILGITEVVGYAIYDEASA